MSVTLPPPPLREPMTNEAGRLSPNWERWLQLLASNVRDNPGGGGGVSLGSDAPLMDGTAAAGDDPLGSHQNHRHPTDTSRVAANSAITGATKTKVTYDSKGLVTAGADATTADIAASTDKNYVTDAQLTVIGNTSGTNSGNVTLAAVGSAPSANGASLSGQALTLQPADGSHPGVITSGTQTIGGNKTWSGTATHNGKVTFTDGAGGSTWIAKVDQDHLTTFGGAGFLIGGNVNSGTGQFYTIGYGYATSTSKPPTEIGAVDVSTTGFHKADLVFGTRDVTTDTAPTERMRITAGGLVGIGRTPTTNALEVNGAVESKSTGFVFPDGTTQATASAGGNPIEVKDEGSSLTSAVTSIDFVGAGVTATNTGDAVTVTISGGGGGGSLEVKDEGSSLTTAATSIDFVGSAVTATETSDAVTVTISAAAASDIPWSLATKPASPHADDCEFEGADFAADGWTTEGNPLATAIDPYGNFTTSGDWRHSYNSMRPGWAMFQPAASGSGVFAIHKSITVGTNKLMWARLSFNSRYTSSLTNGDHGIGMFLSASSGGGISTNDLVDFYLNESDTNEYALQVDRTVGGVTTSFETIIAVAAERISFHYIAMQKVGTAFHFWMAPEGGSWVYLPSLAMTYSGATLDRCGLVIVNAATTSPGNMIMGADFLRHYDGADRLP